MAGASTSQSDAAADLRELWPQVSALCLTVDPESRPFASKEKASDLLRAYLKAHGVPSADVPASEVSADSPWERCAIAWVACKLGALLTHCEALTEGAAFCRLGTAVLHSEESLCAGDEARPGAADVVHANVCAAAPALEGVGCAGASDAELERFDNALARLERAAGAIDVAEDKSRDGGDGGRPWPVAWAWLEPEQRPGGDASRAAGTQVFFYLAQVCGHAGRRHDSARYCAITLQRQLAAEPPDVRWARNCLGLSAYYANAGRFGDAAHCVAAALAAARANAARDSADAEEALDAAADCLISRAGLAGRMLTVASTDADDSGDDAAANAPSVRFAIGSLGVGDASDDGWDVPPSTWTAAAKLHNAAAAALSAAFNRYVLDGFVTEHVGCVVEAAKASRAMAGWLNAYWKEASAASRLMDERLGSDVCRHRAVALLHSRGAARARPLLGKLDGAHFHDLSVALWQIHADCSRDAAEAFAAASKAALACGLEQDAAAFTRRERRRWRDAAKSSRAVAEEVVGRGSSPVSDSVASSVLVLDQSKLQACAEARAAASAVVSAARAHHRCAEAIEREVRLGCSAADLAKRAPQAYAHERCALELFKAAHSAADVEAPADANPRSVELFAEEMHLAKEMAELLPQKLASLGMH